MFVSIRHRFTYRLWLWLGLASGLAWGEPPRTWVISVGVDDYVQDSIPDLKFAGADAKLVSQSLQQLAGVPVGNIFTFTSDAVQPDLTPRATNIMHRLHSIKSQCKAQDSLVFFFAGHGLQLEQQGYLLTEESDNRSPETLKVSSLRSDDLFKQLLQMPTNKVLLVFDACRNESGSKGLGDGLSSSFSLSRANLEYATIFSCNVGERSWEWAERKHGFFTYHFAEGLKTGAADSQGTVSLQSLTRYLGDTVPASVQSHAKASQNPIFRYEGPGSDRWVLTRLASKPSTQVLSSGEQARLVAQLDAARAQLEQAQAEKKLLEDRLLLQQAEAKKLLTRLEILERQSAAMPGGDALVASREAAQQQLQKAQQVKAAAGSDVELLQAEKEELQAQNQALQARIKILELKLGKAELSASRDVRLLSDQELVRLKQREQLAAAPQDRLQSQVERLRREQELYLLDVPELAQALPPPDRADPKVAELQAQVELYEESTRVLQQQLQTVGKALLSLQRQKSEADTRLQLAEAALAQSQAEVTRLRGQLSAMAQENAAAQRELVESRQRGEELLERLRLAEEALRKKFPGVAFSSQYASITRRARVSDLMFQVEPNAPDSL